MEVVIVLALLSAFNAQIYATSRLVFSFSKTGYAPSFFGHVNPSRVPIRAVISSLLFAFVSVALQVWGKDLIGILFNAVGGSLLVIWFMIALSQIKLRPQLEAEGSLLVRMWGYPVLSWITVAMIIGLTVLMLFDEQARLQVLTVAIVFAGLSALGVIVGKKAGDDHTRDALV